MITLPTAKIAEKYQTVAIVREIESPENPGGLEKRVSVVPEDVKKLTEERCRVFVETRAGNGVDFCDEEYLRAGAEIQNEDEIYKNKDLVIKFKGPSIASIEQMREGCTLLCMAHFNSFPDRARMLERRQINVIAMEEILESPKFQDPTVILGRTAMAAALQPFADKNSLGGLKIRVLEWTSRTAPAIRRAGNRDPRSLKILQSDVEIDACDALGPDSLYFYDSTTLDNPKLIENLRQLACNLFDLAQFEKNSGVQAVESWREDHVPHEFGLRRIQCLHQTGQAGARYGLSLLKKNKPQLDLANARAVVLGYGNVGQGALHELYDHGLGQIAVLGRSHTQSGRIDYWLKQADIVINGAEQPEHLRGMNFLITNRHLKSFLGDGSVVIDLVGGSPTNRSPVEPVLACTFLDDPHFVQDGVSVSALWGWPMLGMMRETAVAYSGQVVDVLVGRERLIDGLDKLTPGVARALVCGPHLI
ncbi:MAG: alanine dehydrogenase [Hyphomicrobiales bacterium]|nr:alanine dehydrogenase [Hyphomicrobiales bacterium]